MKNKIPNFFILGAPKCGTTAMSEYLRTHPNVCFSDPKEPDFFCKDYPGHVRHDNFNDYQEECFYHCDHKSKVVGEGSVLYLSSKVAVDNILLINPKALFLVMVRNPVNMAHSFHRQLVYNLEENEKNFEIALKLQRSRKKGSNIPKNCPDAKILQYGKICKTGEQLKRLYDQVPKEQVHVIIFDDFVKDTRGEYLKLLDFLRLEDDGRTEFPRINPNQEVNRTWKLGVRKFGDFVYPKIKSVSEKAKDLLGIEDWGVLKRLQSLGEKEVEREPLDPAFREELKDYFRADVELLSRLLDRDLAHWVEPEPVESTGEAK